MVEFGLARAFLLSVRAVKIVNNAHPVHLRSIVNAEPSHLNLIIKSP